MSDYVGLILAMLIGALLAVLTSVALVVFLGDGSIW